MITAVTVPDISHSLNAAQVKLSVMENIMCHYGISNHIGLTQGQESNFSFRTYIYRILEDLLFLEAISLLTLYPLSVFFFNTAKQKKKSLILQNW